MALNLGYEYSLDVSIDNNIEALAIPNLGVESKVYNFKLRTKFKVLRKHDDGDDDEDMYDCEMMENECLTATFCVPTNDDFRELFDQHFSHIHFRLKEYLMPNYQILILIQQVLDFTEQFMSVDPSSVPIVPIVMDVDVCTMQLDGETIDDALDRSVRPNSLTPLELVRRPMEKENNNLCLRDFVLYGLPKVRMEKGFDVMEECPICMGGPRGGALVAWLPCKHAFHIHCVTRWLMKRQSCPLCRHEIVLDEGGLPEEMGCYIYDDIEDHTYHIFNSDF